MDGSAHPVDKKLFDRTRLDSQDRIRRDERLSGSERLVGAELYSRIEYPSGEIWETSVRRLSEKLHLGERTVKRAIAALKAAGWIAVSKHGRKNAYRLGPNWPLSNAQQGPDWHLEGSDRGQNVPEQGPKSTENRGQIGPLYPLEEPLSLPLPDETGAIGAKPSPAPSVERPFFDLGLPGVALRQRLGDDVFRSWLGRVGFAGVLEDELVLTAPTKFVAQHLSANFETAILAAFRVTHASVSRLRVEVPPKAANATSEPRWRSEHPDARWLLDIGIELVADHTGAPRESAELDMRTWLRLCHDNPTTLREILVGASRFGLHGDRFRAKVRQDARAAPQSELRFGPEDRLKRRSAS